MSDALSLEVFEEPHALHHPHNELEVFEAPHSKPLVVEEEKLPGSDLVVTEEPEQAAKDTDWANDGDHSKFTQYLKDKLSKIPQHSGQSIPGCERAISYCKDLSNQLMKAVRSDLHGKLDEVEMDKHYKQLDDMISRLKAQIDKLRANTSTVHAAVESQLIVEGKCDTCVGDVPTWHDVENDRVVCLKCDAEVGSEGLHKVANTPKLNTIVTAFERAIVGSLVNGAVSGGKNIELLWDKLDAKYKFSDREKLSLAQILSDYGFCQILDRVKIGDGDSDNNGELARNYHA
jgi:hypothetical protein